MDIKEWHDLRFSQLGEHNAYNIVDTNNHCLGQVSVLWSATRPASRHSSAVTIQLVPQKTWIITAQFTAGCTLLKFDIEEMTKWNSLPDDDEAGEAVVLYWKRVARCVAMQFIEWLSQED